MISHTTPLNGIHPVLCRERSTRVHDRFALKEPVLFFFVLSLHMAAYINMYRCVRRIIIISYRLFGLTRNNIICVRNRHLDNRSFKFVSFVCIRALFTCCRDTHTHVFLLYSFSFRFLPRIHR